MSSWLSGDNEEIMPFDEVWQYAISKDAIEPSVSLGM